MRGGGNQRKTKEERKGEDRSKEKRDMETRGRAQRKIEGCRRLEEELRGEERRRGKMRRSSTSVSLTGGCQRRRTEGSLPLAKPTRKRWQPGRLMGSGGGTGEADGRRRTGDGDKDERTGDDEAAAATAACEADSYPAAASVKAATAQEEREGERVGLAADWRWQQTDGGVCVDWWGPPSSQWSQ